MTTRETYSISVDGLTAALAELVKQIRTQDPSLGTIRCKLYDGSAVTIVIGEGPVGAENEAWRNHRSPSVAVDAARATAHAAGYAEAVADVDALRSALVEARNVLSLCTTSRIRGTPEYRMVSALGEELGYGAIMSAASSAWAAMFDGSPQEGSQHTCGPSEVTVRSAIARIDEVLSPGAHVGAAKKGGG